MSEVLLAWREMAPIPSQPELSVWTSLTAAEVAALRVNASERQVLEIGTAFGFSTLALASTAEHVWTIDPHDREPAPGLWGLEDAEAMARYRDGTQSAAERNLDRAGLRERVTLCRGYSQDLLREGQPLSEHLAGRVDFAFIDGDHRYAICLEDLRNCERLLARPGVIAVHDYGEGANPEVRPAVNDWLAGREMTLVDTLALVALW